MYLQKLEIRPNEFSFLISYFYWKKKSQAHCIFQTLPPSFINIYTVSIAAQQPRVTTLENPTHRGDYRTIGRTEQHKAESDSRVA